mgnify:CR=1 FL=1
MTDSVTVIAGVATLGRVAPSSARYACHLSRFNGRAYPKIGVWANVAAPPFDAGDFSAFGTTDTRAVISGGELSPARAVFLRL